MMEPLPPGRLRAAWPGLAVVVSLCGIGVWSVVTGGGASCSKPVADKYEPPVYNDPPAPAPAPTTRPSPNQGLEEQALIIDDIVVGTGAVARSGDSVKVHFVGTLLGGKEFDSSRKRTDPFSFDLGAGLVIKGWDRGVAGMAVGGKRKLTIPPSLGYGAHGAPPNIPPLSTLVFEIEMLDVKSKAGGPGSGVRPGTDPSSGEYSLADATRGVPGQGTIYATIETSKGALRCRLYDDKTPVTVANFIGLATGTRAWKDSDTRQWVNRPAYDNTTFHRVIKGFMIQGGDRNGNGKGEPGFTFKDEIWAGAKHDRPGLLCMANRGPHTNGAQFFITDASSAHLDASYTIFGECSPLETVHDIANVPTATGDKPVTPVTITTVTISRLTGS